MSSSPANDPLAGLSPRARRTRALLAALAAAAALAGAFPLDPLVDGWLRTGRPDWVQEVARGASLLGTGTVLLPLLLLVCLRGWVLADRETLEVAGRAAIALILAGLASPVTKLVFSRERPGEFHAGAFHLLGFAAVDASFPSGHTLAAFAMAGALASELPRWRVPILAVASIVPVARVLSGRHFVSDAVAGIALGLLLGAAAPRLVAAWRARRSGGR